MAKLSVEQALSRAKKCEKSGQLDEAVALYAAVLKGAPTNLKAKTGMERASRSRSQLQNAISQIIGLFDQGKLEEVATRCKHLLTTHSQNVILLNILGVALDGMGNTKSAIGAFKKALSIKPNFSDAFYNLGNALKKSADLKGAINCYRKAIRFNPKYIDACNNLAVSLQEAGSLNEAVEAYRMALAIDPNRAETHNNIGVLLQESGQAGEAELAFSKALEINPNYIQALKNLGVTQKTLGKFEAALVSLTKALEIDPTYVEAQFVIGTVFKDMGQTDLAAKAFADSVEIDPSFAEGHRSLGSALKNLGDIEAARTSFRRALEINPDYPECFRNLCGVVKFKKEDSEVEKMLALLEQGDLTTEEQCHLNFALGYAHEHFGDNEKSVAFLKKANSLRREFLGYEFNTDAGLFDDLKASSSKIREINIEDIIDPADPVPIFIVGMPRSGTTLLEQIVSAHAEVSGAGELNYVGRLGHAIAAGVVEPSVENILEFRQEYLSALRKFADGRPYVTDKMPHNFRYVALIACAFPEARIIHTQRDAGATCWSNFYKYFPAAGLGYCFGLDSVVGYYALYKDLMAFWDSQYPERVVHVDYDHLTIEQEGDTRQLIGNLGLPWDDACLSPQENTRAIKTASAVQVRKAVYKGSSQKWKKFEPYLDGAFDSLY